MFVLPLLAAFLPAAGACAIAPTYKKMKKARFLPAILLTALEAVLCVLLVFLPEANCDLVSYGAYGFHIGSGGFSGLYAAVAAFMWLAATVYSPGYFKREEASGKYIFSWLFTLGATVGLFLSRDLFTAFLFFEMLSLASYIWVIEEQNDHAFAAGKTYLTVAVAGGMVLFMGLVLLQSAAGTLVFDELSAACAASEKRGLLFAAGVCLLLGFGAKAGMFPLHVWLPKAHPVAPSPASALLSGVLTKAGVFGIVVIVSKVLAGNARFGKLVLIAGAVTMVTGAVLGVLSVNLKRTLACSSVSQIGFILVGLGSMQLLASYGEAGGEAYAVAAAGTLLHMLNHSLLKLLLFLAAGIVAANAGSLVFDEIRGFGRKKPGFLILFLVGCLGIGGVPGFNGYVSKTLLHEGLAALGELSGKPGYAILEGVFLFSGGMTVCYMAKLFTVLFIDRHPTKQTEFEKTQSGLKGPAGAALGAAAAAVLAMGVLPAAKAAAGKGLSFFGLDGEQMKEAAGLFSYGKFFSLESLKGAAISLGIGALLFALVVLLLMRRKTGYKDLKPSWLDMERFFYVPVLRGLLFVLHEAAKLLLARLPEMIVKGSLAAVKAMGRALFVLAEAGYECVLRFLHILGKASETSDRAYGAGLGTLRFFGLSFQLFDGSVLLLSKGLTARKAPDRPQGLKRVDLKLGRLFEKRLKLENGVEKAVRLRRTVTDTGDMVLRSFAFTMAMTCVGLCIALIYMLL